MQLKQFKVHTAVGSIVIVGALIYWALLTAMCNLKSALMNLQCSLIQEHVHNNFELGHNVIETTKDICCVKKSGSVPTPPLGQDMTQGQFLKVEFNKFEFRVFLLLD